MEKLLIQAMREGLIVLCVCVSVCACGSLCPVSRGDRSLFTFFGTRGQALSSGGCGGGGVHCGSFPLSFAGSSYNWILLGDSVNSAGISFPPQPP